MNIDGRGRYTRIDSFADLKAILDDPTEQFKDQQIQIDNLRACLEAAVTGILKMLKGSPP